MSINNRLINTNAGGGQPEGTGALLYTSSASDGTGGMWISVDDGQSWKQNSFTGIDATDYSYWRASVKWTGSTFVAHKYNTNEIWSSVDGYNWVFNFSMNATLVTSIFTDQVTSVAYISVIEPPVSGQTKNWYIYKSTDGGVNWSLQGSTTFYDFNSPGLVKVYNNYMVMTGNVGGRVSTDAGVSWSSQNSDIRNKNTAFIAQNGAWSALGPFNWNGWTRSTSLTPNNVSSWTQTQNQFNAYMSSFIDHIGDGSNKILGGMFGSSVWRLAYSTNNGANWTQWKANNEYSPIIYHNSYFFYKDGGNLMKSNDFSTEIVASSYPSTSAVNFASITHSL